MPDLEYRVLELSNPMPEPSDSVPEPAEEVRSGRRSVERFQPYLAYVFKPATLVAALMLAGLSLRLVSLGSRALWIDEGITAQFASYDWSRFAKAVTSYPVNMAFYFAVLHVWTRIVGDSEFMLRLPSVLFATATIAIVYSLGEKLFDRRSGLVSAALMTVSVSSIEFAQEARSYTMVVMLVAVSSLFFVESVRKPSFANCAGYVVSSVMCIYSHMFGILVLPAQWLSLFLFRPGWQSARRLTLSAAVIAMCAAPQFLGVARGDVVDLAWLALMGTATRQRILEFIALQTGTGFNLRVALIFLLACAAIAAVMAVLDKKSRAALGFLVLGMVVPAGITLAVSHFKPLFWPRYLLLCQSFFVVFAGAAISHIRPRPLILVAVAVVAVICLRQDFLSYEIPQREDWPGVVRYLASEAKPGDALIVSMGLGWQPLNYYRKRLFPDHGFPSLVYPDANALVPVLADIPVKDALSAPHQRVWLVSTGGNLHPVIYYRRSAGIEAAPSIGSFVQELTKTYHPGGVARFGGVRVYLFDKEEP